MIQDRILPGIYLPDYVPPEKWEFSRKHVQALEWSLTELRKRKRLGTAFQAGGNIGLWPRRMAQFFEKVLTCEPDPICRECLRANTPEHVEVYGVALGDQPGFCNLKRSSTGSHRVLDVGDQPVTPDWVTPTEEKPYHLRVAEAVPVRTIDSFNLDRLDFLQLDIEGYEWHALMGARQTLERTQPALIQIELRDHATKYGQSNEAVRGLLKDLGYKLANARSVGGQDYVFSRR